MNALNDDPPMLPGSSLARPRVLVVCGATATGKSELGVQIARRVGGEVISADSMQLYRGMDVGTGKLPVEERHGVPHHLLDIWDVTETADVARYQAQARAAVAEIAGRGAVPIVVGGSGLYVDAIVLDLRFPGTDPAVRARWQAFADERGAEAAHAELARRDPDAAAAVLPANARRVVRALEVIELTGKPFAASLPREQSWLPHLRLGWSPEPADLDARIATRVAQMLADGWLDEVAALQSHGLRNGRTAARALGYQQLLAHLDGELSLEQARDDTVRATRQFARRQRKWFDRGAGMRWLGAVRPAERLDEALALWSATDRDQDEA